jgi:hypothetical protein
MAASSITIEVGHLFLCYGILQNDLLPSLQLVTKMIEDVELLEEKAEVAKRESSTSGASILTKVEELKEMLNHAKEANDMVCPFIP